MFIRLQVRRSLEIHGTASPGTFPPLNLNTLYSYVLKRAMTHDEEVYPEPYAFKPERFLTSDGRLIDDDTHVAFGFGRRSVSS